MKKSVRPSRIDGAAAAPPSKSFMLRAAAAGLLIGRPVRILNPSFCDDARTGLAAVSALGAEVDIESGPGGAVTIRSGLRPRRDIVDCGESGLCLRMLAPIAALFEGTSTLRAAGSLLRRPVGPIERPLAELGAFARSREGFPPLVVRGPLRGGRAVVEASGSSQLLTGLLLALPRAPLDSVLVAEKPASRPYIRMTLDVLGEFGVRVDDAGGGEYRIRGGQSYNKECCVIEGDWSGAAFLLVAGALAGRVRIEGLKLDSSQGDRRILDVLRAAGAGVSVSAGRVEVSAAPLRAFALDASDCPDLVPPLSALAAAAEGTSVFDGASRLDHKESPRAESLARIFGALGVEISRSGDRLTVRGGRIGGGAVDAGGDHRMAMAAAVAGLAADGPVTIEGAECVAKSYPEFFADLRSLGGQIDE